MKSNYRKRCVKLTNGDYTKVKKVLKKQMSREFRSLFKKGGE